MHLISVMAVGRQTSLKKFDKLPRISHSQKPNASSTRKPLDDQFWLDQMPGVYDEFSPSLEKLVAAGLSPSNLRNRKHSEAAEHSKGKHEKVSPELRGLLMLELSKTWEEHGIPPYFCHTFRAQLEAVTGNHSAKIIAQEVKNLQTKRSRLQYALKAVNLREKSLLQLHEMAEYLATIPSQEQALEVGNSCAEMLHSHRMLTLLAVEKIVEWRNSVADIFYSSSTRRYEKAKRLPFMIDNENYLIKLRSDNDFMRTSAYSRIFSISSIGDPFLLQSIKPVPIQISSKIKSVKTKEMKLVTELPTVVLQRIRMAEHVLLEEVLVTKDQATLKTIPVALSSSAEFDEALPQLSGLNLLETSLAFEYREPDIEEGSEDFELNVVTDLALIENQLNEAAKAVTRSQAYEQISRSPGGKVALPKLSASPFLGPHFELPSISLQRERQDSPISRKIPERPRLKESGKANDTSNDQGFVKIQLVPELPKTLKDAPKPHITPKRPAPKTGKSLEFSKRKRIDSMIPAFEDPDYAFTAALQSIQGKPLYERLTSLGNPPEHTPFHFTPSTPTTLELTSTDPSPAALIPELTPEELNERYLSALNEIADEMLAYVLPDLILEVAASLLSQEKAVAQQVFYSMLEDELVGQATEVAAAVLLEFDLTLAPLIADALVAEAIDQTYYSAAQTVFDEAVAADKERLEALKLKQDQAAKLTAASRICKGIEAEVIEEFCREIARECEEAAQAERRVKKEAQRLKKEKAARLSLGPHLYYDIETVIIEAVCKLVVEESIEEAKAARLKAIALKKEENQRIGESVAPLIYSRLEAEVIEELSLLLALSTREAMKAEDQMKIEALKQHKDKLAGALYEDLLTDWFNSSWLQTLAEELLDKHQAPKTNITLNIPNADNGIVGISDKLDSDAFTPRIHSPNVYSNASDSEQPNIGELQFSTIDEPLTYEWPFEIAPDGLEFTKKDLRYVAISASTTTVDSALSNYFIRLPIELETLVAAPKPLVKNVQSGCDSSLHWVVAKDLIIGLVVTSTDPYHDEVLNVLHFSTVEYRFYSSVLSGVLAWLWAIHPSDEVRMSIQSSPNSDNDRLEQKLKAKLTELGFVWKTVADSNEQIRMGLSRPPHVAKRPAVKRGLSFVYLTYIKASRSEADEQPQSEDISTIGNRINIVAGLLRISEESEPSDLPMKRRMQTDLVELLDIACASGKASYNEVEVKQTEEYEAINTIVKSEASFKFPASVSTSHQYGGAKYSYLKVNLVTPR